MAVDSAALVLRIAGKTTGHNLDLVKVEAALTTAQALVSDVVADAWRPVPEAVLDECVLSAGHACYDRTKSSHGTQQFTVVEGEVPVRTPRDPLTSVYPLLIPRYVRGGA